MSIADWRLQGVEFASCNCNWGCPCQFSARPTHGHCQAVVAMRIEQGHFRDTHLDGLCWAGTFAWPGAIHEGNGSCQAFVDERADEAQRQALLTILSGQESEPGANVFQIFSTTISEMFEPQFVPIELSIDVDERLARLRIPGVLEASGEPIRSPVTGAPQRARLVLPDGFEFIEAEMASGSYQTHGAMQYQSQGSHSHLARVHFTGHGLVR
ncbi:DUF1326 domain-containing protein [Pseudomonas indica]|uniref:DUF1326 domain-containing protein n=1 Tax=Pseudomonas indica TaxID=137658 RepID=UPI000BABFAA0|nr:DUF1326 domain-containing protein [Pseudomonas indica]MBU3058112.1 DUF1326 domain-containing protein [Pseudomonas indica]PAU57446.1 hypothetical protein BZL42_14740 [Pseudomonas indica]